MDKLQDFPVPAQTVFLEDILAGVTVREKLVALLKARFLPARFLVPHAGGPDDTAAVIFSSGSTGEPKGIMLTHHNILSNVESFLMVFPFSRNDRMCAVLPFFHSFGFTCTLWTPLLHGFPVLYHPNPIDGGKIAEIVREHRLTVLLSTPTFLLAYIRKAKPEDFRTLRAVMVGAEKLTARVADAFEKRFGIRPLEGYGTTELSPVAALNVPDAETGGVSQVGTKEGSTGHPIPGVAMKVVSPDDGKELPEGQEGALMVKGPNVMAGYLGKKDKTTEVIRDGWYDTGDIARIDEDGFVFILDRISRYSKIGGEMVPHLAVEEKYLDMLSADGRALAVSAAPDERKGEQLVVFHTPEAGEAENLHHIITESDLPNLWKPRKDNYCRVDSLPTLGSGKLDLKRLRAMAREFVENRPGAVQRAVTRIREAL